MHVLLVNNIADLQWNLNTEPLNQNTNEHINNRKITVISPFLMHTYTSVIPR
jgi:hypothetical protein